MTDPRALLAAQARIDDLNREMDLLLYAVSHDLRAPLRSIDGFSGALQEDYGPDMDETARDYLNRIRSASKRMEAYLDGLLLTSRETRGEILAEEVDLTAMVRGLAEEFGRSAPDRTAQWIVAEGCRARTDRRLLRTALRKLVDNAWKFTRKTPAPRIEFGRRTEEGQTVFFLRDNGVGLDLAYAKDKLFGMFQRLNDDSDFEGAGVGLATARRIIARLGGGLQGAGEPGSWAEFSFFLPDLGQ